MSQEKRITVRVGNGGGNIRKAYNIGDNIKKVVIEIDVIDYRTGRKEARVKFREVYQNDGACETCEFTNDVY